MTDKLQASIIEKNIKIYCRDRKYKITSAPIAFNNRFREYPYQYNPHCDEYGWMGMIIWAREHCLDFRFNTDWFYFKNKDDGEKYYNHWARKSI